MSDMSAEALIKLSVTDISDLSIDVSDNVADNLCYVGPRQTCHSRHVSASPTSFSGGVFSTDLI